MKRRNFLTASAGLALGSLALGACTTTKPDAPTDKAARRRELDSGVDATLSRLYGSVNGSRELGNRARGILVFPKTLSAGFIVGGEYGDGSLRSGGATRGYYRLVSGSVGWQIGAQSKSVILMFLTQDAYDKFVRSSGWTAGVDATVALATVGASGVLDTNTAQQPIVGFVMTNAGLMAGLSLEGSKVTRLDL
ncbi:YSC84-related protein [Cupriavidus sp. NPDC089707]|uniref:BPSL1445 family SYLF domain-containing lipoprotein n=1 Tax=Cupriavidus sp. NPDC089707 TaxID=3363963 RepID=UPI00380C33CB